MLSLRDAKAREERVWPAGERAEENYASTMLQLCFKLVSEVLKNVEGDFFRKAVLNAAIQTISSSPSGQSVLNSQTADISACQSLFRFFLPSLLTLLRPQRCRRRHRAGRQQ